MFASRLKKARKDANLTLEELSNIYNTRYDGKISKGTLSKYENNKQEPLISVARNLSQILNVSADYLLGNINEYNRVIKITVGERIKELRTALGISQVELAHKIGSSKQNIYKYETGIISNIPTEKLESIASVLKTTPAYLMGWNEKVPSSISESALNKVLSNLLPYLSDLTEEEAEKVSAFIQGLKANR